jgi:hypothetical protein
MSITNCAYKTERLPILISLGSLSTYYIHTHTVILSLPKNTLFLGIPKLEMKWKDW